MNKKRETNSNNLSIQTVDTKHLDPLEALENDMSQILESCKYYVSSGTGKVIKNKIKRNSSNDSESTLEQIAQDMKSVLEDVKKNLKDYKIQKDSYSDVEPTLEIMIKDQMTRYEENAGLDNYETDDADAEVSVQVPDPNPVNPTTKVTSKTKIAQSSKIRNNNKNAMKKISETLGNSLSESLKQHFLLGSTTNSKTYLSYNKRNQRTNLSGKCAINASVNSNSSKIGPNISKQNTKRSKINKSEKSTNPNVVSSAIIKKASSKNSTSRKISVTSVRNTLKHSSPKRRVDKKCSPINPIDKTYSFRVTPSNVADRKLAKPSSPETSEYSTNSSKVVTKCATPPTKPSTAASEKRSNPSSASGKINEKNSIKTNTNLIQNYSSGPISKAVPPKSGSSFSNNKRLTMAPGRIDRQVYNPLAQYKEEVDAAIQAKKTFTVKGNYNSLGSYGAIRRGLIRRGWVEKLPNLYRDLTTNELKSFAQKPIVELLDLIRQKHTATELCKKLIKSKLLCTHQVDLYWGFNQSGYKECPDRSKLTLINKIRWNSSAYTNKQGLSNQSKKAFWYHIPGVSNLNHPRSYRLVKDGDAEEFVKDFNLTAAMSLLKWVKLVSDNQTSRIMSPSGKVPIKIFDFAVNECYKFIKKAIHEDIDHEIKEALSLDWNEFLEFFYKTVHIGNHFKQEKGMTELDLVRRVNFILAKLKDHWPYLDMDGLMNIWILKPTNSCRGVGIHMCRTLSYVLDTVKANPTRRYIIQKYIERPMLIYNTKFDIRQWFLISCCSPLTIWMYKQCYLRFSSQTYNLRKLHESIHLTNNSVQCKYQNNTRDINLPSFNMWDSVQFRNYLTDMGYQKVYNETIYPGMKQCITAAVLMHYENMNARRNCFELYGADFILTEDFKPWLLEINSNPALYASTPITARLCPRVLDDVLKVVVDYSRDRKASTGGFELIYKGIETHCKHKDLTVDGKKIKLQECEETNLKKNESISIKKKVFKKESSCISDLGKGMKNTLEGLLELIQKERARRENNLLNRDNVCSFLDSEIQTSEESSSYVHYSGKAEVAIQS